MKNRKLYVSLLVLAVLLFFNMKSKADDVTLQEMCETSSFTEIKEAIQAGAKVNSKDEIGRTPLMAACETKSSHEIIQLLVSFHANVNDKDNEGRTALMYAAQYNPYPKVTSELIRFGANVNARDNKGNSVMWYLNKNPSKNKESIRAILTKAGKTK